MNKHQNKAIVNGKTNERAKKTSHEQQPIEELKLTDTRYRVCCYYNTKKNIYTICVQLNQFSVIVVAVSSSSKMKSHWLMQKYK